MCEWMSILNMIPLTSVLSVALFADGMRPGVVALENSGELRFNILKFKKFFVKLFVTFFAVPLQTV